MEETQKTYAFSPIGIVHSRHTKPEETPIQPVFAADCKGQIEVFPEFEEGLMDVERYSHLYLLYYLHKAGEVRLLAKPFLQNQLHGIFSTRATARPNYIGLSIVKLVRREKNILYVEGVDILDGTPLLDIKPYLARFDRVDTQRNGWQDGVDEETAWKSGRQGYRG